MKTIDKIDFILESVLSWEFQLALDSFKKFVQFEKNDQKIELELIKLANFYSINQNKFEELVKILEDWYNKKYNKNLQIDLRKNKWKKI